MEGMITTDCPNDLHLLQQVSPQNSAFLYDSKNVKIQILLLLVSNNYLEFFQEICLASKNYVYSFTYFAYLCNYIGIKLREMFSKVQL